jgi:hypothetical protein
MASQAVLPSLCTTLAQLCFCLLLLLLQLGLLTPAEAESCIALEFNPVRVGFHGGAGGSNSKRDYAVCGRAAAHAGFACHKLCRDLASLLVDECFCWPADVWTRDVLNLGVRPDRLVAVMRQKLEAAGGKVYEEVQLVRCSYSGGASLHYHTALQCS